MMKSKLSIGLMFVFLTSSRAGNLNSCIDFYTAKGRVAVSFNDVLQVLKRNPYDLNKLPVIPIQIWQFASKRLSFFVAKRSKEILNDTRDFRQVPMTKPIHSMGIGLVGHLKMQKSPWSGIFSGGEFPVIARASISQGNPLKFKEDGTAQKRSTAMALKVFSSLDPNEKTVTANAVFQNNLNGLLGNDGKAINFLESAQTNNPPVDFKKLQYSYEWLTLFGVALGSLSTPKDHTSKFPFINPQIRPVHSLAEMGVTNPKDIKTPIWVKIQPRTGSHVVEESDFRLEILRSIEENSSTVYDFYAADLRNKNGEIQWVLVGELTFNQGILSEGVDQNLLFAHDSLHSKISGKKFEFPKPSSE